ncbi:MAG: hypothetical protein K1X47_03720 [Cyclobacteriaceae bacterium]|nr:hypothetical protein [Cyclobacteriaceae bacterium]
MTLSRILTYVFMAGSLYLAYFLYNGVQSVIDEKESISTKEAALIERLRLIREAEIVFQEQFGRYTANFDSLATFIETGRVPIIERREEIKQKAYGGEEVILHIDTLGYIPAKERIFKKTYNVNAADNGIFQGFKVKVGDVVLTNQKAYGLKIGDQIKEPGFIDNGTVERLSDVKVGDEITKGQNLVTLWEYQFNPNVDFKKIGFLPYDETKKLDVYVGTVDKGGLKVDVIEVKDPAPVNPARKESNDAKARKPLRFGSRLDVSTAGNWE